MSKEISLDLPWDAIDAGKGLAIDIGKLHIFLQFMDGGLGGVAVRVLTSNL